LLRHAQTQGCFGAVVQKGHEDAGQVFVLFNRDGRLIDLLAPPPGPSTNDDGTRLFERVFDEPQTWADITAWLERKRRIDTDFWVVEIDSRTGFLDLLPESKSDSQKGSAP
jgi:hypothetical protein